MEQLDVLLAAECRANLRLQEALAITEQPPGSTPLGRLQLADDLLKPSRLQHRCPFVCVELLRLVVDDVREALCRDGAKLFNRFTKLRFARSIAETI